MIHTSLSPNTEADDLWQALKQLIFPWKWFSWRTGSGARHLEKAFQNCLGVKQAVSFQRGRDALYVLLKSLGIEEGDEVILQAYTCVVVPNAIQYTGAKPVYVDIEEGGFNMDPELAKAAITPRTKVLIVQHTFGEPADLKAFQALCKEHDIILIEDCAHALSGKYEDKLLGTFGKAAIWSFGRDKVLSSVWGGMVTTDDGELHQKIRDTQRQVPYPSRFQVLQALLHPLLFALIKPIYRWKIGKGVLVLFQKLKCLPKVIFAEEKQGKRFAFHPQKMPSVMAELAQHQLKKLDRFHQHRQTVAEYYQEQLKEVEGLTHPKVAPVSTPAWLRYTLRSVDAAQILSEARKKGIYLGDWYTTVLAPSDCQTKAFQYIEGSCPRAEKAAQESFNLPTHIQVTQAQRERLVSFLKDLCASGKC